MNLDIKLHKQDLPDEIKFSDKIAVDCEFTGLNIERDRLCLLQISSGQNDAHIIQLNKDNYDAPNLKNILTDEKIKKLFHFARADLTFIKRYLLVDVNNIEDTKLQSKLARSYTDKHGLKDLIKEEVEERFDHKNLNMDVIEFKKLMPSAENIAVVIYNILKKKIDHDLDLEITLYETPRNFVKYTGP